MKCTYYLCIFSDATDLTDKWQHGVQFFETYVFDDWQFLIFFLMLLTIDMILNFYKSFSTKTLTLKLVGILFQKVLIYTCFLVLVHIVSHYTIDGEKNSFFGWFSSVAYSAVMVRESISILENISSIRPELIPLWILKRLKHYDKTGEYTRRSTRKVSK